MKDIVVQVGRTGVLTPKAELESPRTKVHFRKVNISVFAVNVSIFRHFGGKRAL